MAPVLPHETERPRVGIGVMVFKDRRVLMARRRNAHGAGEYAFPGGHLEHMESFETCARREVREEAGIEITNIRFLLLANTRQYAPRHYVHITLVANWLSGEPALLEPEKSEAWSWFHPKNPPSPLFSLCALSFDAFANGGHYFDAAPAGT